MTRNETDAIFAAEALEMERGDRLLFTGLTFAVAAGTLVRLSGANGTGKTSLLRLLTGLMTPDEGRILYKGKDIRDLKEDYWRDLVYIGHMNGVKDDLTARENVRISSRFGNLIVTDEEADAALKKVGLGGFLEHTTGELSQGQRRRVALARLFVSANKPVWILDEPFTALDASSVANLTSAVAEHVLAGGVVIYTTHQEVQVPVDDAFKLTVTVSDFAPAGYATEEVSKEADCA